jgi:hypothetical protein
MSAAGATRRASRTASSEPFVVGRGGVSLAAQFDEDSGRHVGVDTSADVHFGARLRPAPNGVGAIRVLSLPPFKVREEITVVGAARPPRVSSAVGHAGARLRRRDRPHGCGRGYGRHLDASSDTPLLGRELGRPPSDRRARKRTGPRIRAPGTGRGSRIVPGSGNDRARDDLWL